MSTEVALTISPRLRDVLPALTTEQREGLEANILQDGKITDPICHWHDGEAEVIVDGMNRFEIAAKHGLPYKTERLEFAGYDEACLWIFERQTKRRNLTPQQLAELRGKWHNALKRSKADNLPKSGENATPPEGTDSPKDQIDPLAKTQGNTPISGKKTAEVIAEKTGVSTATVKRDARKDQTIEAIPEPIRNGIHTALWKAAQPDLDRFVKLDPGDQQAAARAIRVGQAATLKAAMKRMAAPKSAAGSIKDKCPNCAGKKWTEADGVVVCAKCQHPHGESTGGADEDRVATQRAKTVKTAEALQRAFDDLNLLLPKKEHKQAVTGCKELLRTARGWK